MNNLIRHIEVLLLEHDCVIVPDFGGFIATRQPAHYVFAEQHFTPPVRVITFNKDLKDNDGLLAQLYMQSFDATYPQAMLQLEKDINALIVALDTTCSVQMGALGNLVKDINGRITLTANEGQQIPSPELYSLMTCAISPIQEFQEETEKEEVVQLQNEEKQEETTEVVNTVQNNDEKKKNPHLQIIDFSIAAAVAAILLLVFAIPGFNTYADQEETYIAGTPITHSRQSVQTTAVPSANVAPKPAVKPEVTSAAVQSKDTFTIVLACNVTEINAKTFIQSLEKRGIKGAIFNAGKTTRIVYGSYANEGTAIDSLRSMRQKDVAFADAWILKPHNR